MVHRKGSISGWRNLRVNFTYDKKSVLAKGLASPLSHQAGHLAADTLVYSQREFEMGQHPGRQFERPSKIQMAHLLNLTSLLPGFF